MFCFICCGFSPSLQRSVHLTTPLPHYLTSLEVGYLQLGQMSAGQSLAIIATILPARGAGGGGEAPHKTHVALLHHKWSNHRPHIDIVTTRPWSITTHHSSHILPPILTTTHWSLLSPCRLCHTSPLLTYALLHLIQCECGHVNTNQTKPLKQNNSI